MTNVRNIKIHNDGTIFNKSSKTPFSLAIPRNIFLGMNTCKNYNAVKYIFDDNQVRLTDEIRTDIALYLLKNHSKIIIDILKDRFDYVVIDEAQDLNNYREEFAKILFESGIKTIVLGDDYQNINGGGDWFKNLIPNEVCTKTFRCPDNNCKWIRENLSIEIYGVDKQSVIKKITYDDVKNYDDGNTLLLYPANSGENRNIISNWNGPKMTIKSSKGLTINRSIVIIGKTINKNNAYTAITRTTKDVYYTFNV